MSKAGGVILVMAVARLDSTAAKGLEQATFAGTGGKPETLNTYYRCLNSLWKIYPDTGQGAVTRYGSGRFVGITMRKFTAVGVIVSIGFMLIASLWAEIVPDPTPAANVVYGTTHPNDAQEIAGKIAQQYAAANARNFDGYMAAFWRSPLLVYVIEGAVWTGWDAVRAHLEREYPAPSAMGHAVLERLQTNFVDPETAITVEYWTVYFPASRVHGVSVGSWRKLPEGWRMVQASTNSTETP